MKVAVLDDYQSVAESLADWSQLPANAEVSFFSDHLTSEDALAERLADFEVVMGMRERTPFRRSLLERLPKLRLLVTTGRRNASFDIEAASDLGIAVCGTDGAGGRTDRAGLGPDPGNPPEHPRRGPAHPRGQMGHHGRRGPQGQDDRLPGAGPHWVPGRQGGRRVRYEHHCLEPEPHRRARPRMRSPRWWTRRRCSGIPISFPST